MLISICNLIIKGLIQTNSQGKTRLMDFIDEQRMSALYEKFIEFYKKIADEYGKVTHCFGDWGGLGQTLTFGLNRYLQQKGIPLKVDDCVKGRIVDRIELDCQLFGQNKRYILRKCSGLISAYSEALWNDKVEDERLDDFTTDIDSLDANEYSYFSFYDKLTTNIKM
jgi:hypothetical protein